MRRLLITALAVAALGNALGAKTAEAGERGLYEVVGVEKGDMLKMRAGPGTGFIVIVGLPNGTALRLRSCQQTGGTRWCQVALDQARGLKGYVSWAYLRKM